ncbi:hypothetical protein MSAN_00121400 [Mycena sanguinolenta]|uniref:Uncharacterized protein n=1 Tax=Mycena sanguinolenta TaxID=230812 RepID=A0A8H6ZDM7_9AGAR|nr:hypothetical protein MSAN_00121400 [Mycena sanguinolenta]
MDDQPNLNAEFPYSSTYEPQSPSAASGMFSHSQQFTVTGGTFISIMNYNYTAAPSLPSDLRMIPMGDIELRHEIRVNEYTGVAYFRPRERVCVRRIHSANAIIAGRKSRVTVAIYQGNDAEEHWRQDIAKHMSMRQVTWTFSLLICLLMHATRHPNIVQVCGAASSSGVHATLFNDDLIPLQKILDYHRDSHFSTVYIYACCNSDFSAVHRHMYSTSRRYFHASDCTNWIRRLTGRLCAELTPASDNMCLWPSLSELPNSSRMYPSSAVAETITTFINSLTLKQYYNICGWNLGQHRWIALSPDTCVHPANLR